MLAFDALVGNNDRHPLNWGVIVTTSGDLPPCFSPVFDTARALFWNTRESDVRTILSNEQKLEKYIRKSRPQIGWDNLKDLNHLDLVSKIYGDFPVYRSQIDKYIYCELDDKGECMINKEFGRLMSESRRELILKCLRQRQRLLRDTVRSCVRSAEEN
jgi:hypothetical protein